MIAQRIASMQRLNCTAHKVWTTVAQNRNADFEAAYWVDPEASRFRNRVPDPGIYKGTARRVTSSRRSNPVGSASTNCDTSGWNLPGSLANGRLPGAVRPMRSAKGAVIPARATKSGLSPGSPAFRGCCADVARGLCGRGARLLHHFPGCRADATECCGAKASHRLQNPESAPGSRRFPNRRFRLPEMAARQGGEANAGGSANTGRPPRVPPPLSSQTVPSHHTVPRTGWGEPAQP